MGRWVTRSVWVGQEGWKDFLFKRLFFTVARVKMRLRGVRRRPLRLFVNESFFLRLYFFSLAYVNQCAVVNGSKVLGRSGKTTLWYFLCGTCVCIE